MQTLGIDFGGTTIKMGVCAEADITTKLDPVPTDDSDTPEEFVDLVREQIRTLNAAGTKVSAVGVGVPGFADWETGCTFGLTNVEGWENIPLRDRLEKATGLPVVVDNDANAMTYAEWRLGAGRGSRNMVAVTLGTGVGGGLVLNEKMYRGSRSLAGEIGQMSIDYKGRPAPYGNYGALERYIGNQQITDRAVALYRIAGAVRTTGECTPRLLAEAAGNGDALAVRLWRKIARELAAGLANTIWLLNPDRIVIGGGIAKAGDLLFEPLRVNLDNQLDPSFGCDLSVVPAAFGAEAGVIGIAMMAADQAAELN